MIDGLQDITKDIASLAGQDRIMRSSITTINDVETLGIVAEVCEKDHPRLSNATSTKADAISLPTTFKRDISDWADTAEDSDSDAETVDAIESWTATEMKHKLFSLLKTRRDRVAANESAVQQDNPDEQSTEQSTQQEPEVAASESPPITISDIEDNERILEDMAAANLDLDFQDELEAINQWFRVLSDAERVALYYAGLRSTSRESKSDSSSPFSDIRQN